jgi:hypothetical protein
LRRTRSRPLQNALDFDGCLALGVFLPPVHPHLFVAILAAADGDVVRIDFLAECVEGTSNNEVFAG